MKEKASILEVAQIIGLFVSCLPATDFGPLHYRQLEMQKSQALLSSKGNFSAEMALTKSMKEDLVWWVEHVHAMSKFMLKEGPPFNTLVHRCL